jgi:hypothetical protein
LAASRLSSITGGGSYPERLPLSGTPPPKPRGSSSRGLMNGKGFVKRLTQRPGKVVLLSDNPESPPLEEPEESQDIEIVGRVHCAIANAD